MGFKFIDKSQKGFARYCPTFAKMYGCMKEGLRKRADASKIQKLARDVFNENIKVRQSASWALQRIQKWAVDLSDEDVEVREIAVSNLSDAAHREMRITAAIPALAKALDDAELFVRIHSANALSFSARQEDIIAAIPGLAKALGDENEALQKNAAVALGHAGIHRDQKTLTLIVNEIIRFMRSDWFQNEMEKNSVRYERITIEITQILDNTREAEQKKAA